MVQRLYILYNIGLCLHIHAVQFTTSLTCEAIYHFSIIPLSPNGCWVVKSKRNISHLVVLDDCHICTLVSEWNPCSAPFKSYTPFNFSEASEKTVMANIQKFLRAIECKSNVIGSCHCRYSWLGFFLLVDKKSMILNWQSFTINHVYCWSDMILHTPYSMP